MLNSEKCTEPVSSCVTVKLTGEHLPGNRLTVISETAHLLQLPLLCSIYPEAGCVGVWWSFVCSMGTDAMVATSVSVCVCVCVRACTLSFTEDHMPTVGPVT